MCVLLCSSSCSIYFESFWCPFQEFPNVLRKGLLILIWQRGNTPNNSGLLLWCGTSGIISLRSFSIYYLYIRKIFDSSTCCDTHFLSVQITTPKINPSDHFVVLQLVLQFQGSIYLYESYSSDTMLKARFWPFSRHVSLFICLLK